FDRGDELDIGLGRTTPPNCRAAPGSLGDIGSGDTDRLADRLHRKPSFGHDSDRNICFFGPAANSSASFRISVSIVFLPSRRCNSRTWFWSARYSDAATTSPSAVVAVNAPCEASLRQRKSWFG